MVVRLSLAWGVFFPLVKNGFLCVVLVSGEARIKRRTTLQRREGGCGERLGGGGGHVRVLYDQSSACLDRALPVPLTGGWLGDWVAGWVCFNKRCPTVVNGY